MFTLLALILALVTAFIVPTPTPAEVTVAERVELWIPPADSILVRVLKRKLWMAGVRDGRRMELFLRWWGPACVDEFLCAKEFGTLSTHIILTAPLSQLIMLRAAGRRSMAAIADHLLATSSMGVNGRVVDTIAQRRFRAGTLPRSRDFEIGVEIGPRVLKAARFLFTRFLTIGVPILFHGRDGELLYRVYVALFGTNGTRYVPIGRKVTTQTNYDKVALEWLRRAIPPEVPMIHVDTGYSGSTIRWMRCRKWNIAEIWLLSADDDFRELEIPGIDFPGTEIEGLLEHRPQRLAVAVDARREGVKFPAYSPKANAFWERVAGVLSTWHPPETDPPA